MPRSAVCSHGFRVAATADRPAQEAAAALDRLMAYVEAYARETLRYPFDGPALQ